MDEKTVQALAQAAELPLAEERLAMIGVQLATWIQGANELARTLRAPDHWTVTPVTVFRHPNVEGRQE